MPGRQRTEKRHIDRLTKDDYSIFRLGKSNFSYITDHYFRSPATGTYWRRTPEPYDEERAAGWHALWSVWRKAGKPHDTFPLKTPDGRMIVYQIQWDDNKDPIFFHNHGWLPQPWQLNMHHASQADTICVGGMAVGKTAAVAISLAVCAMTIPWFKGYSIAPEMKQALEVFNYIRTAGYGTPFWDRFVWSFPESPTPKIVLKGDYIGESVIQLLSLKDDPAKIRTLEGDYVIIDQTEMFGEILPDVRRDAGSRLRGIVRGRPRMNKMVMIANAGDSPEMWDLVALANHDPKNYYYIHPTSYDNPYLTKRDLRLLEARVGGTQAAIDQWMRAMRPAGTGDHFTGEIVAKNTDESLNSLLDYQVGLPDGDPSKVFGFVKLTEDRIGIYHYEFPPDFEGGRSYVVIGDPGIGNRPKRNSAPIMVWDITDFPEHPATLVAFHWVDGNGSIWPFMVEFQRLVELYHAYGRCAMDSTGTQRNMEEIAFENTNLMVEGLDMAGQGKMRSLNAAKTYAAKGLMHHPHLPYLATQLTSYKLPDDKISQDLAACYIMSAGYMQRFFYENATPQKPIDEDDMLAQGGDRYERPLVDRDQRFSR